MKTLLIICLTVLLSASLNAQEVIQLKEAKVEAPSPFEQFKQNGNEFSFILKETSQGDFQKDPIAFVEKHLDMGNFASYLDSEYESYVVNIRSSKGFLVGNYNKNGELLYSSYKFKNIALPYALTQQVYLDNVGWKLQKTVFLGNTNGDREETSIYKVTMKNGNQKKTLKYAKSNLQRERVAGLY